MRITTAVTTSPVDVEDGRRITVLTGVRLSLVMTRDETYAAYRAMDDFDIRSPELSRGLRKAFARRDETVRFSVALSAEAAYRALRELPTDDTVNASLGSISAALGNALRDDARRIESDATR